MPLLEIAATSLEDALNAANGGADSIEISRDLTAGGLTPDAGLVAAITQQFRSQLAIHIMVRPHARSFVYDSAGLAQIRESIQLFKTLGVHSIVFGACDASSRLDTELIQRIQHEAAPLPLTVHRALDQSFEPERALEKLAVMGITRVLTAGPAPNAWDGREALGRWVARFAGKIEFVASGGLRLDQIPQMRVATNAQVFHFGSAARTNDVIDVLKVRALKLQLGKY